MPRSTPAFLACLLTIIAALNHSTGQVAQAEDRPLLQQRTPPASAPIVLAQYRSNGAAESNAGAVFAAQSMLARLGYAVGEADGEMGPRTLEAIVAFQRARGMPATGRLDAGLIKELQAAVAATDNAPGRNLAAEATSAPLADAAGDRPSFDCSRAGRPDERAICASPELRRLDRDVAQFYLPISTDRANRDVQRRFLAERVECRGNVACLRQVYEVRLAELRRASGSPPAASSAVPPVPASVATLLPELRLHQGLPATDKYAPSTRRGIAYLLTLVRFNENRALLDDSRMAFGFAQAFLSGPRRAELLSRYNWAGNNEFEQDRAHRAFIEHDAPVLLQAAPRLPMQVVIVDDFDIGRFDRARGGFPIAGLRLELDGAPAQFPIPTFAPMAEAAAEQVLRHLGNRRRVQIAATVTVTRVGAEARDLSYRLERLIAYSDEALRTALHQFPTEQAPASVSDGQSTIARMDSADITAETILLAQLKAGLEPGARLDWASEARARLQFEQRIYATNAGANWKAIDPWGPFHPRSASQSTVRKEAYEAWTRERAKSLPNRLVLRSRGHLMADGAVANTGATATAGIPAVLPDIQLSDFHGLDERSSVVSYTGAQIRGLEELVGRSVGGTANRLILIGREQPDEFRALLFERPAEDFRIKVDAQALQGAVNRVRAAQGDTRLEVRFSLSHGEPRRLMADRLNLVVLPVKGLSASVHVGGMEVGKASFDQQAVPSYGTGDRTVERPTEAVLPLDAETLDLLLVKHLPDSLSDADWTRMLLARFALEKRPMPGQTIRWGRHFRNISLEPNTEDTSRLLEGFKAWTRARADQLPAKFQTQFGRTGETLVRFSSALSEPRSEEGLRSEVMGCRKDANREPAQCDRLEAAVIMQDRLTPILGTQGWQSFGPRVQCTSNDAYCAKSVSLSHVHPGGLTLNTLFEISQQVVTRLPASDGRPANLDFIVEVTGARIADRLPESDRAAAGFFLQKPPVKLPVPVLSLTLIKADMVDPTTKQVRLPLSLEPIQPQAVKPVPPKVSPGRYDIIGIRLGQSFAEAEKLIRNHMEVGRVLKGTRARSDNPLITPATSGKLFISVDGREIIALIDEPPAAPERVLAVWRRIYSEAGQIPVQEVLQALRQKYGPASSGQVYENFNLWTENGSRCGSHAYSYGGQQIALSTNWLNDEASPPVILPDGQVVPDVRFPIGMLDPLDRRKVLGTCGEALSVNVEFSASRGLRAGFPTKSLDWVESILSDVEPYAEAFAKSRKALQDAGRSAGTGSSGRAPGIKF
ncbi:peptidoglycan-binding protein [Bosea beijingensis]